MGDELSDNLDDLSGEYRIAFPGTLIHLSRRTRHRKSVENATILGSKTL